MLLLFPEPHLEFYHGFAPNHFFEFRVKEVEKIRVFPVNKHVRSQL